MFISIVIMSHKVPRESERACGFRKGNPVYISKKEDSIEEQTGESLARWIPRLTQAELARVTKVTPASLIEIPDAEGHSGEAKMLRPRRADHNDDDLTSTYLREDTSEEMRLDDKGQMERMYNECIEQHSVTERGECVTPRLTVAREIKVGLCWQCCLRCMKCGYTSKMYKLYHEVETGKRGRKPWRSKTSKVSGSCQKVSGSCQKVSGSWQRSARRSATSSSPERRSTYTHAR